MIFQLEQVSIITEVKEQIKKLEKLFLQILPKDMHFTKFIL